jgi:hypothetical protein
MARISADIYTSSVSIYICNSVSMAQTSADICSPVSIYIYCTYDLNVLAVVVRIFEPLLAEVVQMKRNFCHFI